MAKAPGVVQPKCMGENMRSRGVEEIGSFAPGGAQADVSVTPVKYDTLTAPLPPSVLAILARLPQHTPAP